MTRCCVRDCRSGDQRVGPASVVKKGYRGNGLIRPRTWNPEDLEGLVGGGGVILVPCYNSSMDRPVGKTGRPYTATLSERENVRESVYITKGPMAPANGPPFLASSSPRVPVATALSPVSLAPLAMADATARAPR